MRIQLNAHSGTDRNGNTDYCWEFSGHHRRLADALIAHGVRIPDCGDELHDGVVDIEIEFAQYAALPARLRRRVDSLIA